VSGAEKNKQSSGGGGLGSIGGRCPPALLIGKVKHVQSYPAGPGKERHESLDTEIRKVADR
jgi:hypothetical protein